MSKIRKNTNPLSFKQTLQFLTTKQFFIHLAFMFLFVLIVIFGTLFILKIYTNHGQKLELPDYIGENIDAAITDARRKSFKVIVNDSVHRLNVAGGTILNQNPAALSKVKENRKIYVTISKYTPDFVLSDYLPDLYGRDFDMKRRELENQDIFVTIKDFKYDNAEPNTILEVWYKGKQIINRSGKKNGVQIEKGSTIEMVLSKTDGGKMLIPEVTCLQLAQAEFVIEQNRLKIGEITRQGRITDLKSAWIIKQDPEHDELSEMQMGETINLTVSQNKPADCF